MNRLNFDNLKNLEIPDTWIENALSIPANHKSKSRSFLSYSRVVATAACFMVVCAASFSVFFFMNDNGGIPISNRTSTTTATERKDHTQNSVTTATITDTQIENYFLSSEFSETTQKITEATEKPSVSDATVPDTEPAESLVADSTLSSRETESAETPTIPSVTYPTVVTTQQPITAETQVSTTQPLVIPTVSVESTTSATVDDDWCDIQSNGICYGNFPKSQLVGNVYCRLYDSDGKLVGDSNLYSSQHLAHYVIEAGNNVYVQYFLSDAGLDLSSGTYIYYFYNANGVDLYTDFVNV